MMLYANLADSAPGKSFPDYLTVADVNGYFRINNVKVGKYRLYALEDVNSNNKYDPPDETFAFFDSVLDVNPERNYKLPDPEIKDTVKVKKGERASKKVPFRYGDHKLFLFNGEKKAHYLVSSDRKMAYQFMYYLSLPPDTMKFRFGFEDNGSYNYFREKNAAGDTIMIWLRDSSLYLKPTIRTVVEFPYTDSTGNNIYKRDSIAMRFTMPTRPGKAKQQSTFKISVNVSTAGIKPGQKIIFSSSTPLRPPDTTKIRLYRIHDKTRTREPVTFRADSLNSRNYFLTNKFNTGDKYLFIRDKGSFSNIYGEMSDSSGFNINVREPDTYGHLKMDVTNGNGNLIVQLLSDKESVLEERFLKNSGMADFSLLEPGIYRLRVIYDTNGDGKWTTGDFSKNRQPEAVSYFHQEMQVKADWEYDENWDVGDLHLKGETLKEKKEQ
jgi:hypothetical protein